MVSAVKATIPPPWRGIYHSHALVHRLPQLQRPPKEMFLKPTSDLLPPSVAPLTIQKRLYPVVSKITAPKDGLIPLLGT